MKAWLNSYRDRRLKKRTFRQLWIIRISAYLNSKWIRYSQFMNNVANSEMFLNRKMLSEICSKHPVVMDEVIKAVS